MKVGFVTFANTSYMPPARILAEAGSFGVFDFVRSLNELDIADYIQKHKAFIDANPRGYGFYIWKPKVILDTLEGMDEGDILVYCDAGMKLNINGLSRFYEYIDKVRKPDCHTLLFSTNESYVPQRYVKQDAVMHYFPEFNDTERFKRYYYAGVLILKKTDKTMAMLRDYLALCETEDLLTYSSTKMYPEVPVFQGNDGDASLFNLCVAKHSIHSEIYPDETMLYVDGIQKYDATDWSLLDKYPFQCRRIRPGNKQYAEEISNIHPRTNAVYSFAQGRLRLRMG